MGTITLDKYVSDKGIFLNPELLSQFMNNKVQITIREVEADKIDSELMKFAGVLSNEEAEELSKSAEECRTIEPDSWL
ncbi:MAG: hypothetical protein V1779_02760 [bacterium]